MTKGHAGWGEQVKTVGPHSSGAGTLFCFIMVENGGKGSMAKIGSSPTPRRNAAHGELLLRTLETSMKPISVSFPRLGSAAGVDEAEGSATGCSDAVFRFVFSSSLILAVRNALISGASLIPDAHRTAFNASPNLC